VKLSAAEIRAAVRLAGIGFAETAFRELSLFDSLEQL
jgi:hypothetical protein